VKRFLHLLVNPSTDQALETIALQARAPDIRVMVVVGPGVRTPPLPDGVEAYRLGEGDSLPAVDHDRLLQLIFQADTVVSW